jgi:hypothetical protein
MKGQAEMSALLSKNTSPDRATANTPTKGGVPRIPPSSSPFPPSPQEAGQRYSRAVPASPVGIPELLSEGYEDFTHDGETVLLMHWVWDHGVTQLAMLLPETTAHVRIEPQGMSINIRSRTTEDWYDDVSSDHCTCKGFQYRHHCEHQFIASRMQRMAHAWLDRRERDARMRVKLDELDRKHWEEVLA